jgi:hypothetical protein
LTCSWVSPFRRTPYPAAVMISKISSRPIVSSRSDRISIRSSLPRSET